MARNPDATAHNDTFRPAPREAKAVTLTRRSQLNLAEVSTREFAALPLIAWIDSSSINVSVDSGLVTLTGTVANLFQKRQADDDAWDIPGVLGGNNNLIITG